MKLNARFVIIGLLLTLSVLPMMAQESTSEPPANYTVVYGGSSFDGQTTTFTYTVTGTGVPTALSHFDLGLPVCQPPLELVAYTPVEAVSLGVDPTIGVDGIKWDLPLGEAESRTYTVTFQGYVAEGTVITAVKNGDRFFTVEVLGPSCNQPSIDIEKYVSADGGATWNDADELPGVDVPAGAQVSFRLVVTNNGNVPLNTIAVTDNLLDTSMCSLPATLEPNAAFECVLGPLSAAAQHSNVATVTASFNGIAVTDADNANYFFGVLPAIEVKKYVAVNGSANWVDADTAPGADVQVGSTIMFRFVVRNTGNVPLTSLGLSDNTVDVSSCVLPPTLEPDQTAECVAGPFPVEADQHTNVATVTADYQGTAVQDTDSASYFGRTAPVVVNGFTVVYKGRVYAGGRTVFTYTVTGTGVPPDLSHFDIEIPICDRPLELVSYNPADAVKLGLDPTTGVNGIKWDMPLKMTESRTYSITFNGNVAEGSVLVAVKGGNGFEALTLPGPTCEVAAITVSKSVSLDGGVTWNDADSVPGPDAQMGGAVHFRFLVTNAGTSDLSGIILSDNTLDTQGCTLPATLAAGAFFECVLGPFPVEAGQHTNTATVQGTFADGTGITTDTDTANYFGGDRPELEVEGYVSSNSGAVWVDADQAPGLLVEVSKNVTFLFRFTNTGNVALNGITVSDSVHNLSACVVPATLEPGASFECTAGPVVVEASDHGNTTTASVNFNGVTVSDTDDTHYLGGDLDDIDGDDNVIIVIDGPVEAINGNIIVIYGMEIEIDPNHPILVTIKIGDNVHIEGNLVDNGTTIIIVAINIIIIDVDIIVQPQPGVPNVVPPGCKITGNGKGKPHLKCSKKSSKKS